jgi:hypothetical protein
VESQEKLLKIFEPLQKKRPETRATTGIDCKPSVQCPLQTLFLQKMVPEPAPAVDKTRSKSNGVDQKMLQPRMGSGFYDFTFAAFMHVSRPEFPNDFQ